jgi:hypothetical protein
LYNSGDRSIDESTINNILDFILILLNAYILIHMIKNVKVIESRD